MPSTNGHGPKRAILYARVSTDEQARTGFSLRQQMERLREYAAQEGCEVLEEVEDPGQSGASLERPGMARVRDLVAAGGVSEGTPVHSGPFDLPATAMGAGMDGLGDGVIIVGTTLACEVIVDRADTGGEPGGQTLCMPEPDRWLRAMPAMVGTASMDLTLELLGSTHTDIEDFLAERARPARTASMCCRSSPPRASAPPSSIRTPAGSSQA